jgi:putative ABC transport system permease protein
MNLGIGLAQGMREILAHRLRSTIAMLAIVLGAGSLLATLALTEGIARQERRFLQSLGGVERFTIRKAPVPADQDALPEISPGMTMKDVLSLRARSDLVAAVSPSHRIQPGPTITYKNLTLNAGSFVGIDPDFHIIRKQVLASGRFLTRLDVERSRPVCVLGSRVVEELGFTAENAIGRKLGFNGTFFEIVGALSSMQLDWLDDEIEIPHTTAFHVFEEGKAVPATSFGTIIGSVRDPDQLENSILQLKQDMLKNHRGVEDFGFDTLQDWSDSIESRIVAVRVSGGVIASVSLLVGGIGVANVMLAAIKQRIREIGVRRAIGAQRSDIFVQILLEAFILALLGGVLGIFAGWGIVAFFKVAAVSKSIPIIMPTALLWSFASAVVTGVVAGIYPALRGAAMSPMEALRYE